MAQEVSHVERDEGSNWSSPFVWRNEQRTEIITAGSRRTRPYDLDGKSLYEFSGASSITIATPYAAHRLAVRQFGLPAGPVSTYLGDQAGCSGDITLKVDEDSNAFVAWCKKQGAPATPRHWSTADYLYVLFDRGFLACYNAHSGEPVYDRQRLPGGRAFTASPWAYRDHIFCASEYGETFVVKAGPQFELVHQNAFADEPMIMASPAMTDEKLLIRTDTHLYCLQQKATTDGTPGER